MRCFNLQRFLLLVAALVAGPIAHAQEFPTRPVRIVVPYGPIGGPDVVSRLIAAHMSTTIGNTVLVENRGGGGGIPAISEVLNAQADGHTLFAADSSQWATLPALQTVPYNFVRDFAPVGLVFTGTQTFVVPTSLQVNTLEELIALARAKPGQLNYGTPGIGGLQHFEGEAFKAALKLDIKHIPYKSGGEMVESVMRGDTQIIISAPSTVGPHVASGKLKLLAITMGRRTEIVPGLRTVAEITGIKDFDYTGQMGIVVKAGTAKPVVDKISASLNRALANPEIRAKVLALGIEITPTTPEDFGELIRNDVRKFASVAKVANLKME